jgi:UDP-N-acetylglucosamine 2-epimerase (non-hydrolysing)|tara:strand:- start:12462 stop:13532 length:1071 start_codon:yes stop_codon:yes gene_type:complete
MTKKTIVTVTGIRPDFIRMSEVINQLDRDQRFEHILVHTGQHYDDLLSGVFFRDLEIREPDYNLSVGGPGKKHYHQQAVLGPKLIELFIKESINPDLILFLGDSNSVLASVPLRKEGYKIGHIEAGMRSYDERMLEEINRKVCDHVSNLLFVYHENYREKAKREGISEDKIFVVGNTIIEPLKKIADLSYVGTNNHILLDIHRPENFKEKERLQSILDFAKLCEQKTGIKVKMLNFGRTTKAIRDYGLSTGDIEIVELMGYKEFVRFMQDSKFIISDSGTAQEEPAILGVPVIVPRDFTERPESMENNNSVLLDISDNSCYINTIEWALSSSGSSFGWLGDGTTSRKILDIIGAKI